MRPGISFINQGKERDNRTLLQDGGGEVGEKYSNSGNVLMMKLRVSSGEQEVECEGSGEQSNTIMLEC